MASRWWQAACKLIPRTSHKAWPVAPLGLAVFAGVAVGRAQHCTVKCSSTRNPEKKDKLETSLWVSGSTEGSRDLMAADYDTYGGVVVNPDAVPKDAELFRQKMQSSLAEWSKLKKNGVWLRLCIGKADLVPIATAEFGFQYHHAEKDYLMLTKWLPKDKPNTLPMNASHTVGVGAIVTDAEQRVLLVLERSGPAARLGIWKLPTGLVDAGEDLHVAAIREVKEETGVDVTFDFMGAYVVNHGGNLAHKNKSNIFFIVKCSATSTAISAQDGEIAEARWFTQQEWADMPFPDKDSVWHALNRSALDDDYARVEARLLPWGKNRPHLTRWVYCPTLRSAL